MTISALRLPVIFVIVIGFCACERQQQSSSEDSVLRDYVEKPLLAGKAGKAKAEERDNRLKQQLDDMDE